MSANDKFKVESGITLPPRTNRGRVGTKYPWPAMQAGDSFLVPLPAGDRIARERAYAAVRRAGSAWCAKHRPDCTLRLRYEARGVRVWMVSR